MQYGAHTLPTPTATQTLMPTCVWQPWPLCVCTRPHVCAPGEHMCEHACLQQCICVWSVRVYLCMQINTWGEGVSVCGLHACL